MNEMKEKLKAFFMSDLGVDGDVLQFDTPLFGERKTQGLLYV